MEAESINGPRKNGVVLHSVTAKRMKSFCLTEKQIRTGPVFRTRNGRPFDRSAITT